MKKSALLFLLAAVITASSCKKESDTGDHTVFIDMQYGFDNDDVTIYIDGEEKFEGNITSNPTLGLAHRISSLQNGGTHMLKIVVNNGRSATVPFSIKKDLYIGVGNSTSNSFEFDFQNTPFAYD